MRFSPSTCSACVWLSMAGLLFAGCTPQQPESAAADVARQSPVAAQAYEVDPFWPKDLPDGWMLGNVVGVAVDEQDNVWIVHRANSYPLAAKTPPVIAFDSQGNVIRSWGGPGDGYEWGTQAHGLTIDYRGNVWVGFGGGLPYDIKSRATTDNAHFLKFTPEGRFLLQIGKFGTGTEGSDSQMFLGQPTDVFVDPETDEAYVTDGYTNRRVIVFDANTGAYKRHWGAYGKPPKDTAPAAGSERPDQFDTPHCVVVANDGLVYVCDRNNGRVQVFRKDSMFVKEMFFGDLDAQSRRTGRPGDLDFSRDPGQSHLVMVDMGRDRIYTLRRDSLEEIGSFGRIGRGAGHLLTPHSLALDSKGHLFVAETTDGSRLQRFVPRSPRQPH
jgi:DNA-binding beta-propeller fold protein YncE